MKISLWREDLGAVAIVVAAGILLGAIDRLEPQIVAETTRQAQDKKEALPPEIYFTHPLGTTWIKQSGNDAHGDAIPNPRPRHSMAADLTERSK